MAVIYKLVGFDRRTERIASAHEIPADRVERAKRIAGIADRPEVVGDWPLTTDQAGAIADIIHKPIDLRGVDYSLSHTRPSGDWTSRLGGRGAPYWENSRESTPRPKRRNVSRYCNFGGRNCGPDLVKSLPCATTCWGAGW